MDGAFNFVLCNVLYIFSMTGGGIALTQVDGVTPDCSQTRLATAGLTRENSPVKKAPSFFCWVSLSIFISVPNSTP